MWFLKFFFVQLWNRLQNFEEQDAQSLCSASLCGVCMGSVQVRRPPSTVQKTCNLLAYSGNGATVNAFLSICNLFSGFSWVKEVMHSRTFILYNFLMMK